ncbi:MAG: hypothetical protein ACE5GX_20485 [Thermoanaerobaculia bacterium]
MPDEPTSDQTPNLVRVMVELKVPEAEELTATLLEAPAFMATGFALDGDYDPIPMSPPPEMATAMEAAHETLALVRGMIEESRIAELEADEKVVSVWRDTQIAHFG